jgi:hypothetical protein
LAAQLLWFWHRGNKKVRAATDFSETRDCQSIAGFVLLTQNRNERKDMNKNKTHVPTEFGPETRFELQPGPPVPFRATRENEFERLKRQLLTLQLAELDKPELNTPLRRAANEAAALAWVTLYPLLVFPALFEEKAALAVRQTERQARIYEASRELLGV